MKKLFSFVFVLILCVTGFGLTACNQPETLTDTTPDTSNESSDASAETPPVTNENESEESTKPEEPEDSTEPEPIEEPTEPEEPILTYTDIGYEVLVYPDCAFYYKPTEDCTIHITEISMTLSAKNEINENDVLTEPFYSYVYSFLAIATTDPSFYGESVMIFLKYDARWGFSNSSIVSEDGTIIWGTDILSNSAIESIAFFEVYCPDL